MDPWRFLLYPGSTTSQGPPFAESNPREVPTHSSVRHWMAPCSGSDREASYRASHKRLGKSQERRYH